MPSNLENSLVSWTKPPSDSEDVKCENAETLINAAIKSDKALEKYRLEVFAQGSYANNTNVKLNSDVDIIVCNMSALYGDYPKGKIAADFGLKDSNITFLSFKEEVRQALVSYFGEKFVNPGKKAFDILPERNLRWLELSGHEILLG